MGRIAGGLNVASGSWHALRREPKLLCYPAVALGGQVAAIAVYSGLVFALGPDQERSTGEIVALYLYLVASTALSAWAAVGISVVIQDRINGGTAPWTIGFAEANKRLPRILQWSLLAASVGLALRLLQDRLGWVGKLVVGGLGVAWSLATVMVIPVIAFEDAGPFTAVNRSKSLFRARWGEEIAGGFANGVRILGVWLVAIVIGAIAFMINPWLGFIVAVVLLGAVVTIEEALSSVFQTCLYHYARTGEQPRFFTPDEIGCYAKTC
jgi:hypothetical protein